MRDVVIAGACRTPIGRLGGSLAAVSAVDLATTVIREAVRRAQLAPSDVEEVILGQVIQAGSGPNSARQASLKAGVPVETPAYTVNMVCASGMRAIALGAASIGAGEREIVVAGGTESMSQAPYLLPKGREGYRLGDGAVLDAILCDALTDPSLACHMALTVEGLVKEYAIPREDQDRFAAASQAKAKAATARGAFAKEIVGVSIPQRRGAAKVVDTDEHPRPETTEESLSKLAPAFEKDGTITAGNASGINDGAAAVVLMSDREAQRRGIRPLARVVSWASAGVEPGRMGIGPVPASRKALERAELSLPDIDVVELNEAFAAQCLAVMRELELPDERVNVNGGAIALGHPVGASGARIVVTLLHALEERDLHRGLATLCVGGGQGMAMVLERVR